MRAALAFAALLVGCAPGLSDVEGFYGCADGVTCPGAYPHCHRDLRCYSSADDGGAPGARCEDADDCGTALSCEDNPADDAYQRNPSLLCLQACGDDLPCPGEEACVDGVCVPGCDEDCDGMARCRQVHEMGSGALGYASCVDIDGELELDGHMGCAPMQPGCDPPAFCVAIDVGGMNDAGLDDVGVCSLRCATDDECPGAGECVSFQHISTSVEDEWGQCMARCETDADCTDGLTCRDIRIERGAGTSAQRLCAPATWDDVTVQTFRFPFGSMMMTPPGG